MQACEANIIAQVRAFAVNALLPLLRLPQDCFLCGHFSGREVLCPACGSALPRLSREACPQCALPTPAGNICGSCLSHPPAFDGTVAALEYGFPTDVLIQSFKYRGNLALASVLADQIIEVCAARLRVDLVVPMPLSRMRLRERGFNQAVELSKRISGITGIPLLLEGCTRTRETRPQASLPWKERAGNVRGAFQCSLNLSGKRVAVVDDVMATGATLNALCQVLKRHGAASIEAWIVARALAGQV